MNIKKIVESPLLNKAALSREIKLNSPAVFNQKIKGTAGNKLTEENKAAIKLVVEKSVHEAEIINLQKLIDIIKLFTGLNTKMDRETIKTIISDYQNTYSDIGLMDWFEENY
jgi:hypothetical protein